jgi:putative oxidoreductase
MSGLITRVVYSSGMKPILGSFSGPVYAAMRIVVAFLYFCHGLQKLTGAFGGHQVPLVSLLGIASVIEIVLGALIFIGWYTSAAAFVASGEMAVAYFHTHFPRGGLPIQNEGELAVAFCFVFLFIATRGAGPLSVDGY